MLSKISSSCLGPGGHSLCTCFNIKMWLRFTGEVRMQLWRSLLVLNVFVWYLSFKTIQIDRTETFYIRYYVREGVISAATALSLLAIVHSVSLLAKYQIHTGFQWNSWLEIQRTREVKNWIMFYLLLHKHTHICILVSLSWRWMWWLQSPPASNSWQRHVRHFSTVQNLPLLIS